jgi:recombination protein RecT
MPEQQPLTPAPAPPQDNAPAIDDAVQALAKQPRSRTVKQLLESDEFKLALAKVLPRAMRADRFVRVALTTMMRTPELAECSRESLFRCMLDCSSYGLEPDGRRAHLIPFRRKNLCQCGHEMETHRGQQCSKCDCQNRRTLVECTLIIDYKGLAELVRRSGDVSYIHADVVYEKDDWSFGYGTDAHLRHRPAVGDRGAKPLCFYSYVRLKDGSEDFTVMSKGEVDKIRARSKSGDSGPWVTDYDEMGKKTAFRRHSKWLPLSPEVKSAIERDDDDVVEGTTSSASATWGDLLETGEAAGQPKRLTAHDVVMRNAPEASEAQPGPSQEPQP